MDERRDDEKATGPLLLDVIQEGASWRFEGGGGREVGIGRSPSCDIPLTARKVSRRHARIVIEGGGYFLVDDGSRNGTFLGGERVSRARLSEGDEIAVGTARIVVRRLPAGERPSKDPDTGSGGAPALAAGDESQGGPGPRDSAGRRARRRMGRSARRRPASRLQWGRGLAVTGVLLVAGLLTALLGWRLMDDRETGEGLSLERSRGSGSPVDPGDADGSGPDALLPLPPARAFEKGGAGGAAPLVDEPAGRTRALERSPILSGPDGPRSRLSALVEEARRGELGWETVDYLRQIIESSFDPLERREAERHLALLEGVRAAVGGERRDALEREISGLLGRGRFGVAAQLAAVLSRAAPSAEERELWSRRRKEIETRAQSALDDLEGELSAFLGKREPGSALERLLEARGLYGGLSSYESLVGDYLRAALEPEAESGSSLRGSPEALRLLDEAAIAFDECRFHDLARIRCSLLAMDLPPAVRLEQCGELVKAAYMGRMFDDVVETLEKEPLAVSLLPGNEGSVLGAGRDGIEYELRVGQSAYRSTRPWSRLTPSTKLELFEAAPLSPDGQVGLALFSFELGDIEGAHRALLALRRRPGHRDLADSVLAWHRGEPVPEGGYVVHEGRLVAPEERDLILARRERIREEERAAREELRKLERSSRISAFIDFARGHRERGNFELAHAVLRAIAGRFGTTDEGADARRLLEDPILHVEAFEENGPPENRLDFYFLGEGYPVEDDYQEAFLTRARVGMKLILAEEPFREYRSYLNFSAVQLGSRDRGVDRQPGEVERDTALGGKVVYDRFTVDRSKTRAILARLGEGGRDGQALVIGNDYAGVSTGGGGITAVTKIALTALAHEIGHSLAGLRDEYDYQPGMGPGRSVPRREENVPTRELPPNLMEGSNRDEVLSRVLWKHWIDAGEEAWWNRSKVSVFEGGNLTPFNTWRPQAMCKMRSSATRFCVVCMEVMVLRIYDHVRPIDRAEPEAGPIDLGSGEDVRVKVWTMKPEGRFLEANWTFERLPGSPGEEGPTVVASEAKRLPLPHVFRRLDPEGGAVEMALLRARELDEGRYRLRIDVRDTTPWVIKDPEGRLTDAREWVVEVRGE